MTGEGPLRSRLPPVFESLASLYRPADPGFQTLIVDAGDRWAVPPPPAREVDVLLWGRLGRNVRPSMDAIPFAARRELAILRCGPARQAACDSPSFIGCHRSRVRGASGRPSARPPSAGSSWSSSAATVLSVSWTRSRWRPVRRRSGTDCVPAATARPSRGSSSTTARSPSCGSAAVGHTKDPARGREALLALAEADVPLVPKPLRGGTTAGAAWATESVLTGEHVQQLTPDLLDQITRFLAALPAGPPGRRAVDDQLAEVADVFPEHGAALRSVAAAGARWGTSLPPVLIHGDLWLNNVFVEDGRLSGVFDWDTWHPAGLPGTDMLTLLAAETRTQQGRDIGPLFVDEYWRSAEVIDAFRPYFAARSLPFPDTAGLAAIAVGWWASRISGSLHRARRVVDDPAWTRTNITDVLAKVEQLERELG